MRTLDNEDIAPSLHSFARGIALQGAYLLYYDELFIRGPGDNMQIRVIAVQNFATREAGIARCLRSNLWVWPTSTE
ncbi:MAG: hypothetical protein AUG82_03055 [Ktedonobacter sp. 13_1_20CM_4_53_11]|nr:MAG: hypothetical protein AUG82_03055 [Ktedonobacter sp. 13_1_20CM_4_53_11]